MAAMPEGRMTRTGAPASSADGLRTTARAAPSRREPLAPRADLQAAAMMQLPPSVQSLPATPSPAVQGTPSPWLDAASRALDMTTTPLPRDGDASALAAGALPTAAADASFSAALEAAGSTMPEFMLQEALDSAGFTPALSARIATMVRDGIEEARIQLNPADMGPVAVQLAMEGSDVRVDLAAEVESTRQILEQALPSLASALRESGFTLTGGGVFQQPRDTGHGDRGPSDGRHGASRAEATGETVTTVSTASPGRAPRRGLVDLYA
ncbi:MAG: flagellar hook-length control protein FliK [Rubrivivax sp.]